MRRAFFVIGCESTGTRMMTKALISAGAFGDSGHQQSLDNLNFYDRPDIIVFRRSIPHADMWPPINTLHRMMIAARYTVATFIMWRKEEFTIQSQLRRNHVQSEEKAKEQIKRALKLIGEFSHGKECEVVGYEHFVTDEWYRSELFWDYGLPKPTIEFYNANEAYK
ncbi:hypothetical protein LCGC14_0507430 [marine sediment metagenome]|uniref:Sulfotransferase domain-containing protein n=1 Tax=marine sediment metagenome TaxID=412755 RepID=A0A0F9S294_9ZZZZ